MGSGGTKVGTRGAEVMLMEEEEEAEDGVGAADEVVGLVEGVEVEPERRDRVEVRE